MGKAEITNNPSKKTERKQLQHVHLAIVNNLRVALVITGK